MILIQKIQETEGSPLPSLWLPILAAALYYGKGGPAQVHNLRISVTCLEG